MKVRPLASINIGLQQTREPCKQLYERRFITNPIVAKSRIIINFQCIIKHKSDRELTSDTLRIELQWRIQGGFVGLERTPLLAQVTSVSLCTMRNSRLERTPYLTNSKKILTVAHLGEFLSVSGRLLYRQTRLTRGLRSKVGVATKISRALCARSL